MSMSKFAKDNAAYFEFHSTVCLWNHTPQSKRSWIPRCNGLYTSHISMLSKDLPAMWLSSHCIHLLIL